MSAEVFVDTNVLVYAHDRGAGEKHDVARDLVDRLWRERSAAVSTQVLQELYVNVRRKAQNPVSRNEAALLVEDYFAWEVVVNTERAILEAVSLEERHGISFWDALIVHAAETAGAATLYTEDLNHGQDYGPVRAVNPFVTSTVRQQVPAGPGQGGGAGGHEEGHREPEEGVAGEPEAG